MRLSLKLGAFVLAAALLSGAPVRGQAVPVRADGPAAVGRPAGICDSLPPTAVRSVPAPFDGYMRLMCRDPVGQGLQPAEGFRWTTPDGLAIGLTAMSATGGPNFGGHPRFQTSWYVGLTPTDLSPAEQRRIKLGVGRAVRPGLLESTTVIALRARTSRGEEKLILFIVPEPRPGKPDLLIGLECNGACFRRDTAPLIFAATAD